MSLYVVPKIKKYLVEEKGFDSALVDEFFQYNALGIRCELKEENKLKEAFGYYNKWEAETKRLWNLLKTKDSLNSPLSMNEKIKCINEDLFEKDEDLFIENENIDEVEKTLGSWVAMKVCLDLMNGDIHQYLKTNKILDWSAKEMVEGDEGHAAEFKHITERAIVLMMGLNIIVGSAANCTKVFYMLLDEPKVFTDLDGDDDVLSIFKKSSLVSGRSEALFDAYYAAAFREMLSNISRTGNVIIDIVWNDKIRDFIVAL